MRDALTGGGKNVKRGFYWALFAWLMSSGVGLHAPGDHKARAASDIETFFRNNIFYIRNNSNRRVMCQVSAMVGRGSGFGTQPGLEPSQKAVVISANSEEAPFNGPVGNPRVFDCRIMK
jgi:hypothetical protein